MTNPEIPDDRLWDQSDIANYLKYSYRHAGRIINKEDDFPAPITIGTGRPRWDPEDVKAWAKSKKDAA